ncbi:transcription factor VOZ1-like [Pyrus ussuriensis x Pyrus communis]|uniref:Transcription factor VOZ1-like n=1 Tax=Pyrus ussuriensis x Pyrus communis TaxID=2448454 RepID=A0A5N5GBP3_9ROSA|nr:transcription factor VOZ1-like [Pyrus ussuriensis x Pyrus communis]
MKPTSQTPVHYISWSSSLARQRKVPKDLTCRRRWEGSLLRLLQKLGRMIREKLAKSLMPDLNRCMYIEYNSEVVKLKEFIDISFVFFARGRVTLPVTRGPTQVSGFGIDACSMKLVLSQTRQ